MELLVVLALIALLAGLGTAAFQAVNRSYSLGAVAGNVQEVLRAARNTSVETGARSHVVVDPQARTVAAHASETVGEWSFEEPAAAERVERARVVAGRVGMGLEFRGADAYVDCGTGSRFDLRTAVTIEAWVRHGEAPPVLPPARERERKGRRLAARPSRREPALAYGILSKQGAYFLGMTRAGALEGGIGAFRARTGAGVVPPHRWVFVAMVYDGESLRLAADGVERLRVERASPEAVSSILDRDRFRKSSSLPPEVPVSTFPLTISSPEYSFPGSIDEVKLRGQGEPRRYRCHEHARILGSSQVIHFDRRGHLDPAFHEESVHIVLEEIPDANEEAPDSRQVVVEVDRLGVVR